MLTLLDDGVLAALLSLLAGSLLCAVLFPLWQPLLRQVNPISASRLMLMYAMLPWVSAFWVVVLIHHPQWAGLLFHRHCHGEVCGPHVPDVSHGSFFAALLAVLATLILLSSGWLIGRQLNRNRRRLLTLEQLSEPTDKPADKPADGVQYQPAWSQIPGDAPLAFTAGLWRPRIYLIDGLNRLLTPAERTHILLHEQAHVWRRDPLRRFVLHWASRLWPAKLRAALSAHHALKCEQACDAIATELSLDTTGLIAVLKRLHGEGHATETTHRTTTAASCGHVQQRIQALTSPDNGSSLDAVMTLLALLLTEIALFTYAGHPLLDLLLPQ